MTSFFKTPIEFLKGLGPQKAAHINKELGIFTYADLLQHYPFRYEDRTKFYKVRELNAEMSNVQVKGQIRSKQLIGAGRKQRLAVQFADETGIMELVWFSGINWISPKLRTGVDYVVYGQPKRFGSKYTMAHPELEILTPAVSQNEFLQPVYSTTETLRKRYLDSKAIFKFQKTLLKEAYNRIPETLPPHILQQYGFLAKRDAVVQIHVPKNQQLLQKARFRMKFDEFFFMQLRLLMQKKVRLEKFKGQLLQKTDLLTEFYQSHLPFDLTGAQKKVIKEIFSDFKSGKQMNRLLQGDVGSGKTIVAFISALIAIDSGAQVALMAPTQILANQHYEGLKEFADKIGVTIALLTGSTKTKARREIHENLKSGELKILVGTHALLEEVVQFQNLGLAIVDEQHRYGVAQRARLWKKNENFVPHVLIMTATPIPRTLSMSVYGDLDISIIDELPKGRKPIKTIHQYDANRLKLNGFLKKEIEKGRQVYVVYPLIEESEKLDLKDLMDGYESIARSFPEYPISIVHGKMKAADKDFEMARFVKGETKLMVATTVIEVGVNVPNASVMVIENAERFGLAQLHQLRGRVGRGAEQSYCVLVTSYKLSKEARTRVETMVRTTDGFEIAQVDMNLRGPGDMMGTQQSGQLDLLIGDLREDEPILSIARQSAQAIIAKDPNLESEENALIRRQVENQKKKNLNWSRIS
ncbi:ATP-dependent DNA helicase RecG [Marivirga tractuosa]|uniref:ATP-dependent DNA helicase RecG n=1 Tax=Marivirga tractuosa (strain ATCC 23168 / DSM 4126 / NBRC 15989 / NCIMB 1408 / VKM B-1430 / H-43) TaxID=643867 RepID=E4TTS4_MARTH|nr:ATP-dependent DNA helicase RecG [Marivirga tractuosa]ADR21979.1 ATP-dependent DNA helicase RecG [Marivirga tractuosa DSM 4126]BDD13561.1 ATP-dependent DNA helicase RecG [Marivirga tractuosa]